MYLCQKVHDTEWSGVLFIRQLKGDLDNPDTLEFEAIDMFLMDIGTPGYTSFEYGPDLVDAYDQNDALMEDGVRTAMIHSHHTMGTFFSPTDKEELEDNTPEDVDMYLSLIVNNKLTWDCKISMFGKRKVTSQGWFKKLGSKVFNYNMKDEREEKVLYIIDVKVFLENLENTARRVEQLLEQKAEKQAAKDLEAKNKQLQLGPGGGFGNGYQNYTNRADDMDWRKPPEPVKSKATGDAIPDEYGKLLMLSTHFSGDFEEALEFVEKSYSDGNHMAYFLNFFRTRYFVVLDELRALAFLGAEKEDDGWDYEITTGLLDEILQWKGAKNPIFKAITNELESFIEQMDAEETAEEEEEDDDDDDNTVTIKANGK